MNSKLEVMTGYGTDREKARQLKRVFLLFDDDGGGDINMGDTYSHMSHIHGCVLHVCCIDGGGDINMGDTHSFLRTHNRTHMAHFNKRGVVCGAGIAQLLWTSSSSFVPHVRREG